MNSKPILILGLLAGAHKITGPYKRTYLEGVRTELQGCALSRFFANYPDGYLADLELAVRISSAHCSAVFSTHFREFSSSELPYM